MRRLSLVCCSVITTLLCSLQVTLGALKCGSCEGGSHLTCPNSFDMQFTVSRYAYEATHYGSLILKCDYYTTQLNFTMMEGCNFPEVIYVKIEQCPLFNESVASVLTKIGVNVDKIKFLLWETSHSVQNGLQSWHLENLHNLTMLQIQNNEFVSFPDEFLKNTPLVRKLYITGNKVSHLPSDFLSYTPEISILDLGNNQLESMSENMLAKVPLLEILNVWTNKFTSIPPRLFASNPLLNSIVLRFNKLTSIDPTLFAGLANLRNLDLQINQLKTLPQSMFDGCNNLTNVDLQYNQIVEVPTNLFQGTVLTVLNLGYNKISNISGVLNNIPTLQNVSLYVNELEYLPADMFLGTTNIVRLDLQSNQISDIAEGVFDGLNKMKIILLNSNSISEMPQGLFRYCLSLLRVFMQKNNISVIPSSTFPEYSDITKLDMSYNRLTFDESLFHPLNKLARLQEIFLAHNNISTIFNEALYVFTRLKFLDLSYNSINLLTDRELVFLSKNVTLKLQHNNISKILTAQSLVVGSSTKILSLELSGNPLVCDCNMHSFLKLAQLKHPFVTNNPYNLIIPDADDTFCFETHSEQNISLSNVDTSKLVCEFSCSLECPCYIRLHDNFILMDCSYRGLYEQPIFTKKFSSIRKRFNLSLDLSNNEYEDVSFLDEDEYEKLINLDLTNNTISSLNESLLPDSVQYMDLRFNNFTSMSSELVGRLNASGMTMHLGGNPWSCDCGLKSFHDFLRDNYELVLDRHQVVCSDGGAPVDELTMEQLCSFLHRPAALASIVAGAVLLLLIAVLITAGWYRHKEIIKVWLYSNNMCLWAVTEHEIDADKKYDAFISYSYKDEGFVNNILVPGLESGDPKYRVCLHYRDWIPGEYIQDQILSSVKASRRTIVVLSKNFIESVWGQLEFKAAHSQALKDKTNRIIIVVYGDVPEQDEMDGELKMYVSINTYLKWGDQRFWERLRYAMPHAKYSRHKNNKTHVDKLELVKPAPKSESKTLDE